jgi:predicted dinucleotide-binding enzyme
MFIAGDDDAAKRTVAQLLHETGWDVADIGDISGSRYLEPMSMVWVRYGARTHAWGHAFKLLRA